MSSGLKRVLRSSLCVSVFTQSYEKSMFLQNKKYLVILTPKTRQMETRRLTLISKPKSGTLSKQCSDAACLSTSGGWAMKWMWCTPSARAMPPVYPARPQPPEPTVCWGCGDYGTVNEVAAGLINTPTALGILPAGSGNGLARHSRHTCRCGALARRDCREPYSQLRLQSRQRPAVSAPPAWDRRRREPSLLYEAPPGLNSYISSAIDEFIKYHPNTYEKCQAPRSPTAPFWCRYATPSQYGNNVFVAPAASIARLPAWTLP